MPLTSADTVPRRPPMDQSNEGRFDVPARSCRTQMKGDEKPHNHTQKSMTCKRYLEGFLCLRSPCFEVYVPGGPIRTNICATALRLTHLCVDCSVF